MKKQRVLLTLVSATVSILLAIVLVWYSKKSLEKTTANEQMPEYPEGGEL